MRSCFQTITRSLGSVLTGVMLLAMVMAIPAQVQARTQEGLVPTSWDAGKVHIIVYKTKTLSDWGRLAGGFAEAAIYLGQKDGQQYVIQARGTGGAPTLETLDAFLNRIDGSVDAIIWALGDGSVDPATAYSVASSVSSSSMVYPPIKDSLASPIFNDTTALSSKITNYFRNRGTYQESSSEKEFFESFGIKDPMASQQILSTLYNSQLDYLFYKYLGATNLENKSPQFVADFSNRIVTPLELVLGSNKRIVYSATYNSVGTPSVNAKVDASGTLYIEWTAAEGMGANEGYTGTIQDISGNTGRSGVEVQGMSDFGYNSPATKGVIFTTPQDKRSLVIPNLPSGDYQVIIMGSGNLNPVLNPGTAGPALQTVKVTEPGSFVPDPTPGSDTLQCTPYNPGWSGSIHCTLTVTPVVAASKCGTLRQYDYLGNLYASYPLSSPGTTFTGSLNNSGPNSFTVTPCPGTTFTGFGGNCSGTGTCVLDGSADQSFTVILN